MHYLEKNTHQHVVIMEPNCQWLSVAVYTHQYTGLPVYTLYI